MSKNDNLSGKDVAVGCGLTTAIGAVALVLFVALVALLVKLFVWIAF